MKKLRTGDTVVVLKGKSKGVTGAIKAFASDNKVVVEGANVMKKHVKPNPNLGTQGGIQEKEQPIHISNVAILNPVSNKKDKVIIKQVEGKNERFYASTGEQIV